MVLIEKYFDVTPEEQQLLDFAQGNLFPYFLQASTKNLKVFGHTLMARYPDDKPYDGIVNSDYYEGFKNIFLRFCGEAGVKVKTIFRAAVNCTTYSNLKHGDVHVDHHAFPHYNFVMYLNNAKGSTYLYGEDGEMLYEVTPDRNKAVVFDGCPHAQGFCGPNEYRFILVFTFLTEDNYAT